MPHATSLSTSSHVRAASQSRSSGAKHAATDLNGDGGLGQNETEKFPDFDAGHAFSNGSTVGQRWQPNGHSYGNGNGIGNGNGNGNATHSADRWHARRDSRVRWAPREPVSGSSGPSAYGRRTSISNAVHRMRSASMSQNAHEIAEALRAPLSWRLIVRTHPLLVDLPQR